MKIETKFIMAILICSLLIIASCDSTSLGVTGIQINTNPAGATIYLDGTNLFMNTPALIDEELVVIGEHHIRLYLGDYNEVNVYFDFEEGEGITIDVNFEEPVPPLPIFTMDTPADQESFDDNIISVSGLIEMEDRSPFLGDHAILNLNGYDWEIAVDEDYYYEIISIASGTNTIWIRANSETGDTGVSNFITVYGNFEAPDIEIGLNWNTPTSDLDLHLWNPLGEHCCYWNMFITEGSLEIDDIEGYGPETFTALDAIDGTYTVKINCYALYYNEFADANVQIWFEGILYDIFGPHHFTVWDYEQGDPEAWWDVAEFTVSNGRILKHLTPVPTWIQKKIERDMKNLPCK